MFPKGNLNRIWFVLGALDTLKKPTLVNITSATGIPKASVNDLLKKLTDGQVPGVTVKKINAEYKITEWLSIRKEVKNIFKNNFARSL